MDILLSLHKQWSDMILCEKKPFDFRNVIPKQMDVGSTIYLYETKNGGGRGQIVGKAIVDDIWLLKDINYGWPMDGAYTFIDWWLENIDNNPAQAAHFREIKKEFYGKLPNLKFGCVIDYALSPSELENLRTTGRLLDTFKIFPNEKVWTIIKENDAGRDIVRKCDDWLESIGFYDDSGESTWMHAIQLRDVKRFDTPHPLNMLLDKNFHSIQRAPQSWMYTHGLCSSLE